MSFWKSIFNVIKNVVTYVITELDKSTNKTRELRSKYEEMNDDELVNIVKKNKGRYSKPERDRSIAYGILRKRGYDVKTIHGSS